MNPIEQIKDRLSILDVVSTYVRLEKAGSSFKARCPFHNEKTPSFHVSVSKNSYHCFGCSKGGDIFSFIQDIEHIPFREALELLADRAGVELVKGKGGALDNSLLALLEDANSFFQDNLKKSGEVMSYVLSRGIREETIETQRIGYAESDWRTLYNFLSKKGYSDVDIERAGLSIKTEKGYYDRFRGRVMFPIRTPSGKVVGFTGRVTPRTEAESKTPLGKYVNTPETELYHKSKILFNYDMAKGSIVENDFCIVVEGQMDAILASQLETKNTVAVSGTAFTDDQLGLIMRMSRNIVLAFDSDKAGKSAMLKCAELALLSDANVEAIYIEDGLDPADCIQKNPNLWIEAVKNRVHVVTHLLTEIRRDIKDDRNFSLEVRRVVIPLVSRIKSHIDREHFIKEIAKALNISVESVSNDLKQYVSTHVLEDSIEAPKESPSEKLRVLSTYEELIGSIELHPELYQENVKKLFEHLYGLNLAQLVPYGDIPESEKTRLQIKAQIMAENTEDRIKSFPNILLEFEERITDIEIDSILEIIKGDGNTDSLAKYQALVEKRNKIRQQKK